MPSLSKTRLKVHTGVDTGAKAHIEVEADTEARLATELKADTAIFRTVVYSTFPLGANLSPETGTRLRSWTDNATQA
jgi:hypothetical protein